MARALRKACAVLFALAVCGLAAAPAARAAPALWVVRDANSTIYLFGTMHVLKPNEQWRTPLFDRAYDRATTLWFETDMEGDQTTIQALMGRYGADPNRTLSEKLSPKTLAALKKALAATPMDLKAVEHMRPWWVALVLSTAPLTDAGLTTENGADATLTVAARGTPKTVRTFESLEQQIHIFADLPEAAQIEFLEDVLGENDDAPAGTADMETSWANGDMVALGWLVADSMRVQRPALYDAVLRRRNLAWADELERQLRGRGVEMVNVGALHLVGPDGIPQILRARGYRVERIQ